ncbi:SMP-30/gluconolactonase/LRE family protein [Sporichthya polymorpha]|uniref:SMP-30/gluconolactonase/LRE family protein n=1 Tax=Sporichthya polymorpha TaxID=35751 RepID=UPI0003807D8E|nr:SMP-30/gluconolactonase/LRE family protein [Sporichthya polymorpha]
MTLTEIGPFRPADLAQVGSGLNRPECVLAAPDGSLYTGDWTVGIARIAPDGTTVPAVEADLIGQGFRPNGIALTAGGDFLFANLGRGGGVWRVGPAGDPRPFATELDGDRVPHANFVLLDGERAWITISARTRAHDHYTADERSGQILLVQDGKVSVAAEGLNWTNELRLSPDGRYLFVNETFACRTTRYVVADDGGLSEPTRIEFSKDTFPDGLAFDSEGALWVTSVITNRLIRVTPDLSWKVLFEDLGPGGSEAIESYARGTLTFDQIARSRGSRVANLSSLAFGGPDLKTIYLGGLGNSAVHSLRSPVAGLPLHHWR